MPLNFPTTSSRRSPQARNLSPSPHHQLPDPTAAAAELLRRRRVRQSYRAWLSVAAPGLKLAKHHEYLAKRLQDVEDGKVKRLAIFMPPGSAKSTYASVYFPPHYIGRFMDRCAITASYAQKLSLRFGRKCRNIVGSALFRRCFGFGLSADTSARDEWETEVGGEYVATSVDGSVTGRRADLIIVDDPLKGRKEADSPLIRDTLWNWYISDVRTRLKPGGAIVLIFTRWHEDDLAGRLFPADYDGRSGKVIARDGETWEVVCIRAEAEADDPLGRKVGEWLWPEWFKPGQLAQEKISQRERNWNALYQQRPAPEEGDYFKRDWLRYYETAPERSTLKIYGSSDFAVTSNGGDYTVHIVVGVDPQDRIFVLDVWRKQTSSDIWVETMLDMVQRWKPLMWAVETGQIEKGVGPFLAKRMRERKAYVGLDGHPSVADKAIRAQSIRGRVAQHMVYFPKGKVDYQGATPIGEGVWSHALIAEMLTFPTGTNDDQVDALGLVGRMLDKMAKGERDKQKEPMRGASEMTMEEAWDLLLKPKRR